MIMNINKYLALSIILGVNIFSVGGSALAATDMSGLAVYTFQRTKSGDIDSARSYMKRFLPREDSSRLEVEKSGIVQYVSDADVNTTFEENLATGDLSFSRNFNRYIGNFVPRLPSEDEAVKYAYEFLQTNGLMPKNPRELKVAHVGGLRTSTVLKGDKPGPIVDKLKSVTLSRELNGIPVIGSGSKILVNIGDKGEVVGAIRRWRELDKSTRLSAAELISEREAMEMAQKQIISEFGKGSRVEVMQTQLAYYDNNGKAIQPVFAIQTKIQLADRALPAMEYVSVIPVMKSPVEDLKLTRIDGNALKLIQGDHSIIPEPSGRGSD
jgi:hypothetical protein